MKSRLMTAIFLASVVAILPCETACAQRDGMEFQIPSEEYNALVDLYNSAGGPTWIANGGWLNPAAQEWVNVLVTGVQYDSSNNVVVQGHVTMLDLGFNNLSGSLKDSLGDLPQLAWLDLGFNDLSGTIPSGLGNLSHLQYLDLSFNGFTGPIPNSFETLLNLTNLTLIFTAIPQRERAGGGLLIGKGFIGVAPKVRF